MSVQASVASPRRSSGRSGTVRTAATTQQPRCEFGGCPEPYAQHCHLKPHAEGSGREARDLVHGCKIHHKLYDAGLIRFLAWTEDGRPLFYDDEGGDFLRPKPLPEERDSAAVPPWMLKALSKRLRRKYERLKKVWDAKPKPPRKPAPPRPEGQVRERARPYRASRPPSTLTLVSDT